MRDFLTFKNKFLIFLFCCAVIVGPAYTTFDHFDFSHSPDTKSYMKMAEWDYDVLITHRYRVIVPALASAIHSPVSALYKALWPDREENKTKGLMMSYFMINTTITSITGLFIYFICLSYGASPLASILSLISFLVSCWTIYIAGLPLVDSLYILIIAVTIYGIKANNKTALIFSILIGPFAKESYIFIAPLILLFGRNTMSLKFQIPLFLLSGTIVFFTRFYIDKIMGTPLDANFNNAFIQFYTIPYTLKRIFSFRGAGEIFRVWGLFTFIFILGFLGGKTAKVSWSSRMDVLSIGLLIAVIIHVLLSGDVGRMLHLASPIFVVAVALILDRHPYFTMFRDLIFTRNK